MFCLLCGCCESMKPLIYDKSLLTSLWWEHIILWDWLDKKAENQVCYFWITFFICFLTAKVEKKINSCFPRIDVRLNELSIWSTFQLFMVSCAFSVVERDTLTQQRDSDLDSREQYLLCTLSITGKWPWEVLLFCSLKLILCIQF